MKWTFSDFTLDADRAELCGPEGLIHVERQPLDVLVHLITHADRVVSRDELIDAVWDGRIVSDATVSTAIKQARRAVGDTGSDQKVIRTIHGRGFRFVAEAQAAPEVRVTTVTEPDPPEVFQQAHATDLAGSGRPSLAVLRFQCLGTSDNGNHLASALPAELISSLSRLGWLHMIARGSSFRFDPDTATPEEVGRLLGVRYLVTGVIEVIGEMMTISIEVLSTADGTLVWSDRFATSFADIHISRVEMISSIISALELEVPKHEATASRRLSEAEFDAWSHYHLGLSHVFRFNPGDNRIAAEHFDAAVRLDPNFSRARAGKSFVHWQNAFMQFGDDRRNLLSRAIEEARIAIDIDPNDPFAAFNLGRARWLEGDLDAGLTWLDRSLQINPNSAQSHYSRGLLKILHGMPGEGSESSKKAITLSPLDPLLYGMHASRALAAIMQDDTETAMQIAERATQAPGAHFYIGMIAAIANELHGNKQSAARWRARVLKERPDATGEMFLQAFPFGNDLDREKFAKAFRQAGF